MQLGLDAGSGMPPASASDGGVASIGTPLFVVSGSKLQITAFVSFPQRLILRIANNRAFNATSAAKSSTLVCCPEVLPETLISISLPIQNRKSPL